MTNYLTTFAVGASLMLAATSAIAGGPPAKEGETKVSYEMSMFNEETSTQGPGMQLAAPGDLVRYTYVITDEYINDPAYKLSRAVLGVHIIDDDPIKDGAEAAMEWGAVRLDGAPRETRDGEMTDFVEMRSDDENERRLPPYIYNIPQLIADDGRIVIEVENLNKEGGRDMSAEYGSFEVLRAGLHLFYVKAE
jgi:hypothetical protein